MDYLELSPNTERAMALPRPQWRGISHRIAAALSPFVFTVLVLAAPDGDARRAMILYGVGTTIMLGTSAVVHLRPWEAQRMELMFRLDHMAIYIMIGASSLAFATTMLEGSARWWLIALTCGLAAVGIIVEWLPFATPQGVGNTAYLVMSWLVVVFVPAMYRQVGLTPLLFLFAGGACYTVGAAIVGLRRPDPNPLVFGYHEIWHLLVIAAVVLHTFLLVSLW